MPTIERNVILSLPVEFAARYLGDPSHFPNFCSNMIEVSDVETHVSGTGKFAWVYKMMGARVFGTAEFAETKHNQQLEMRFWGGIQANIVWRFQPQGEGILLAVRIDYVTPPPLLKKHSEDTIFHQNEQAVEHMLVNLKTLLEAHHARTLNRM